MRKVISSTVIVMLLSLVLTACHNRSLQNIQSANKKSVAKMYDYFSSLRTIALKKNDLSTYFNSNVTMTINGKIVAEGYDGFYNHFKMMLAKSKNFRFVFPANALIAEGRRVAAKYNIVLKHHSKTTVFHVIAIFTLKRHKITSWDEVVSSNSAKFMKLTR